MALLFFDGFDYANNAAVGTLGGWSYSGEWYLDTSLGRFGTKGIRNTGMYGQHMTRVLSSPVSTIIVGFAINPYTPQNTHIMTLGNSSNFQLGLFKTNPGGALYVMRTDGTVLASSSAILVPGTWNYVEMKVTIHDTAGAVEVRVNGISVMSASGIDTKHEGSSVIEYVRWGNAITSSCDFNFDDVYICDTSGTVNNDFLGDVKVVRLKPSAAGDLTQFTPLSGENYTNVDEATDDGDTTYVSTATAGHVDLYHVENLAATPLAIYGVKPLSVIRKDDAGSLTARNIVKSGTTTATGITVAPGTSYAQFSDIIQVDPNTSSAWTKSAVDSLQIGIERVS